MLLRSLSDRFYSQRILRCTQWPRPGYTKDLKTLQLERGIKIVDSPGVVFDEDDAAISQRQKGGILLRNVVKVEDIDFTSHYQIGNTSIPLKARSDDDRNIKTHCGNDGTTLGDAVRFSLPTDHFSFPF